MLTNHQVLVDELIVRHFDLMGHDLCDWVRVMCEARAGAASGWPGLRADRLRAAGEYRQTIARELAYQRRGRAGLRAMLLQQGLPCNW